MKKYQKKKKHSILLYEVGKFMMDIAKYLITGVIITALYKDYQEQKIVVYFASSMIALIVFIAGLLLIKEKED